jgi:hypothetical protein
VLYLAFSLVVALSWHFKVPETFMPDVLSRLIYPIDKSSLSPWRLLHFFSLAVVVVHLIAPDWRGPMKRLLRAMIRCGENSLPTYCLGVLLSFVGHVVSGGFFRLHCHAGRCRLCRHPAHDYCCDLADLGSQAGPPRAKAVLSGAATGFKPAALLRAGL